MKKIGREEAQLDELAIGDLLAFANEKLSERAWERGSAATRVYRGLLLYELLGRAPDANGRNIPVTSKRLARVVSLQREVRRALLAMVNKRDLAPALSAIATEAPFEYVLEGVQQGEEETSRVAPTTVFRWVSAPGGSDRHKVMRRLAEIIVRGTRRIGHCDHENCGRFFVLKRDRPQRFCSERCSTQFWKDTRLASGYFTEKRRENRARQRARKRVAKT